MVVTKAQLGLAAFMVYYIPDIVFFAVDFPVTHEASALLVQKLLAYTTLEASRMRNEGAFDVGVIGMLDVDVLSLLSIRQMVNVFHNRILISSIIAN